MRSSFGGDAGHDDSYFISFSDLLIGMIFLFIIILLGYALSFRSAEVKAAAEKEILVAERDAVEREKEKLRKRIDEIEEIAENLIQREKWRDQMLKRIANGLSEVGVDAVLDLDKGVLRLPEALLFSSGSADLTAQGDKALSLLAEVMDYVMPCYVAHSVGTCNESRRPIVETVLIEGHTDNVPISSGKFRDNWDLSVTRGVNTYQSLTRTSPSLDQMRNSQDEAILGVSGYETRRPVASNASSSQRERNRRIDLRFLIATPDPQNLSAIGQNSIDQP